jgi:hypothetical protein
MLDIGSVVWRIGSVMEHVARTIRAYNGNCMGCKRTKRDIMISYNGESDDETVIHDIFLTTQQAVELVKEIQARLAQNEEAMLDQPSGV